MSYHSAKFSGHRHYTSGDINIPVSMVNLPQMWDLASVTVYTC